MHMVAVVRVTAWRFSTVQGNVLPKIIFLSTCGILCCFRQEQTEMWLLTIIHSTHSGRKVFFHPTVQVILYSTATFPLQISLKEILIRIPSLIIHMALT